MVSSSDSPARFASEKICRAWLPVCVLFAAALFVSQLLEIPARSALRGYDNTFNFLWLRSAMVDHDWDFRNDVLECDTLIPEYRASALALPVTATGRLPNKYGIGWSLLTLPFYVVADVLVSAGRLLGVWSFRNDGFNAVYQVCIQTGHALLAVAALYLAFRSIAHWIGDRRAAMAGVLSVWGASSLVYYQSVNVSMSHGAAFFAVAVMIHGLARADETSTDRIPWLIAGAGWGLAVITRFQLGLFGILIALALLQRLATKRPVTAPALWGALGAAPLLLIQAWAWRVVYGKWLVFGYGAEGEGFHWVTPELSASLFSPWHGLFYWHPFVLVGTVGLLWWAWAQRGVIAGLALVLALTIYLNAAWWCWWFASSFGNRGFDAALLGAMAGTSWLFQRAGPRLKTVFWAVAIAASGWNFYVVMLYRTGAISRNDPVTWFEMLRAGRDLGDALHF